MPKAIRIRSTGGPDVLVFEEVPVAAPGPEEVYLRHTAIGVNYIDTYHRSGLYPLPLPSGIGLEGVGVVKAVGEKVTDLSVGDRVAYAGGPVGAYSEARVMPAAALVKLPGDVSDEVGAAVMLQGLTAYYLIRRTYPVRAGETVLLHAAAGGVGLLASQWLKSLGAIVIGTVGSEQKAALARENGCDHVIVYSREDFTTRVRELTNGSGVPVVFDSVGKDTWEGSLDCLAPRGMMVSFGNSSGPVGPFDIGRLAAKGSLYVTRPTLATYMSTRNELDAAAADLFNVIRQGSVKVAINQRYPLGAAASAHRDLEARRTTGASILLP